MLHVCYAMLCYAMLCYDPAGGRLVLHDRPARQGRADAPLLRQVRPLPLALAVTSPPAPSAPACEAASCLRSPGSVDWTILKTAGTTTVTPATVRTATKAVQDEPVVLIGHPSGLPRKYSASTGQHSIA